MYNSINTNVATYQLIFCGCNAAKYTSYSFRDTFFRVFFFALAGFFKRERIPTRLYFLYFEKITLLYCRFHILLSNKGIFNDNSCGECLLLNMYLIIVGEQQIQEPFICPPNLKIHLGIRATRALLLLCCLP